MIREYGDKNNINMVLIDSNTGATVLGAGRDSDYLVQKVQRYVLGIPGKRTLVLKRHENYVIESNYDTRRPIMISVLVPAIWKAGDFYRTTALCLLCPCH